MRKYLFLIISIIVIVSCSEYSPKPQGSPRIDRAQFREVLFDHAHFSFSYPSDASVEEVKDKQPTQNDFWFNVQYSAYNATIYCTYIPFSKGEFGQLVDDSYHLAYSHAAIAAAISQTGYRDSINHIYGVMYDIEGSVATPIQFYLTDSISNFLRGSLYFDREVKADSISPIVQLLKKDITTLMESLRWKNNNSSTK